MKDAVKDKDSKRFIDSINCRLPQSFLQEVTQMGVENGSLIRHAMLRSALINGSYYGESDSGPIRAMMKCYRGAAFLLDNGRVASTEHLRIENPRVIYASPIDEALEMISDGANFDNQATFFSSAPISLSFGAIPSVLDGDIEKIATSGADAEIRFLEYQLNYMIRKEPNLEKTFNGILETSLHDNEEYQLPPLRNLLPNLRQSVLNELIDLRYADAKLAMDSFIGRLRQDAILPLMEKSGINGCRWYNWLLGQGYEAGINQELGNKRQQALQAFPIFHGLMSKHNHPVTKAVENSTGLTEALTSQLGCSKTTLSSLNGVPVKDVNFLAAPSIKELSKFMDEARLLPPGSKLESKGAWDVFFNALRISRAVAGTDETQIKSLLAELTNKWNTIDPDMMRIAAIALPDMIYDIHNIMVDVFVRHTNGVNEVDRQMVSDQLFKGRRLMDIATAVNNWNEKRGLITASLVSTFPISSVKNGVMTWPGLHDKPVAMNNDYTIHSLMSADDLNEEHRRLKFCIDTYVGRCLYEGSHIVSLRDTEGKTSYAAAEISHDWICENAGKRDREIDPQMNKMPPGVLQFYAEKNKDPSEGQWKALWDYIQKIHQGLIKIDVDTINEDFLVRKKNMYSTQPFDTSSKDCVQEVWRNYREFFPKKIRKRNAENVIWNFVKEEHPEMTLSP